MKTNNTLASEPAPRSVLGIPAQARIQNVVKRKVGAFRRPLDSGIRRNDGKKLTGQQ